MTKQPSPKQAIAHYCKGCIYDPKAKSGTHLAQIEACPITQCSLYHLRPLTLKTKAALKAEKFNALSPEQQQAELIKRERFAQRVRPNTGIKP